MSLRGRTFSALAAALSLAGIAAVTTAPAAPAVASKAISQLSEPDALWLPTPAKAGVLAPAPNRAALVSTVSNAYRFSSMLDGEPVRWDPCTAIHWRSNTARGPVGGLDVLKAAVARISSVTGTTWVYDGPSTAAPSSGYLPKTPTSGDRPVLLGWTDGTASDLLHGRPAQVLGMT